MKQVIKYRCGHEGTVKLQGVSAERRRKAGWLERQLCPDCKREKALAMAERIEKEQDWPPMAGTERQVEWARQIRARAFADVDFARRPPEEKEFLSVYLGSKDAKWWINARDEHPYELFEAQIARWRAGWIRE